MQKIKNTFIRMLSFLKRKWKLLVVLVVIAGLFLGWRYQQQQASKPSLTFVRPEHRNLIKRVEVSGIVDAKEKARLRFLAGGKVVFIGAKEGDWVEKGKTIAMIDQAALQKQLDQYLNSYSKERLDWDQTVDGSKDRTLPTSELRTKQKEQLDLNDTVLSVEIQNIAITNTRLTAPFAGIVTTMPASIVPGMQLLSTDVFEVVNPKSLIFRAEVDETDLTNIQLNQTAALELDAHQDELITTQVSFISFTPSPGAAGTAYYVEFPLAATDLGHYRLGMNGDIAIEVDRRDNVLSIPYETTRSRDDGVYIDVRTGKDTFAERRIETGLETEDFIEVISGLAPTDEVLLPE